MSEIPQRVMSGRFSRRIRNVQIGQWKWGGTWVILAIGLTFIPFTTTKLAAVAFAIIGVWGAWPYSWGPLYSYVPDFRETLAIRRRKGRVARDARPGSRRRATQHEPIDVQIAVFPTSTPERKNLATLYAPPSNSDTIIVTGVAWQGANQEPFSRLTMEDGFANAILDVANMTADSTGITVGLHKGPINLWDSRDWTVGAYGSRVLAAGRRDFDENPPTNTYERQMADFSDTDMRRRLYQREVTAFVGLNVARPDDAKQVFADFRKGDIDARQFERKMLISRMARRLEQNLQAQGVSKAQALDEMGMRNFARSSWDVNIEEWWNLLKDPSSAPPITDRKSILLKDPLWPWPLVEPLALRDEAGRPYIELGGSYWRIARATRMNETVFPGEFKPLFASGDLGLADETSLTIALTGDTFPVSKESKALNYAIVAQEAFSGIFLSDDATLSPEEEEKASMLRDRQKQLHAGGKQGINYNLWATWGATSLDVLREVDGKIEEHARACSIRLNYIQWESRMMRAKFTASIGTPLI